ncbi:MAG: phage holin family protein [Nitrospirae bacterium]|nr:phage holin family protein [Nitrospirota bacterium]
MHHTHDSGRSGFSTVVVGLLRDVRTLVRQELALAQHEVEYEIGKIVKAVLWFVIGLIMAVIGSITIAAACVLILYEYTGLPAWVCAAIVSMILLGAAAGLMAAGRGIVKSVRFIPVRSIQIMRDDVKWMANWVRTRFV